MEVNFVEGIVVVLVGTSMLLFISLTLAAVASLVTATLVGLLGGISAALDRPVLHARGGVLPPRPSGLRHGA